MMCVRLVSFRFMQRVIKRSMAWNNERVRGFDNKQESLSRHETNSVVKGVLKNDFLLQKTIRRLFKNFLLNHQDCNLNSTE